MAYINEIKIQFRDNYKFVPSGGTENDPLFDNIPDGVYPMEIEGKIDYVRIKGEGISCCNFDRPENDIIKEINKIRERLGMSPYSAIKGEEQ